MIVLADMSAMIATVTASPWFGASAVDMAFALEGLFGSETL